ncbi:DUF1330 domain-containing protein [Roseicella sp. DB1501]|uniref:DUF1330 domain-containing protein n=1 Tax=Roseicella sp. DB1501 TaxID=2730925 RepID=UPI00149261D2|nr:DUF1330 domain-containing protein [Roseicella sp. DB1501]NOG72442.1 DUF1330 domain-containing protein [Roseicella sp. DB1501]
MPAYLIASIKVTDPEGFGEYVRQVRPMVACFGGRYLVGGSAFDAVEGEPAPDVLAVLEFADMPALRAFYDSADYAPLLTLRQASTVSHVVLADGVPAR